MNTTTTNNSYLLQGHTPGGIPTWIEDRRGKEEGGEEGTLTLQVLHLLPSSPEGVFLTPGNIPSLLQQQGKPLLPSLIYDLEGNTILLGNDGDKSRVSGIHIAEYRIPFYDLWGGGGKLPTITHTIGGDSYQQTMSHLSLPRNPFTVTMISSFRSEGLQYGTKTTHMTLMHGDIFSGKGLGVTFWVAGSDGTFAPGVKMYLSDFPFRGVGVVGSGRGSKERLRAFREAHAHRLLPGGNSKAEEAAMRRKQERLAQLEQYQQKTQPCATPPTDTGEDLQENQNPGGQDSLKVSVRYFLSPTLRGFLNFLLT